MKHQNMILALFVCWISLITQLNAQIEVKKFQIRSIAPASGGQSFTSNGTFELSPNLIRFSQKNGLVKYDFLIRSFIAHSDDLGVDYEVSFRGVNGMIRWNESTFTVELMKDGEQILPYHFFVEPVN